MAIKTLHIVRVRIDDHKTGKHWRDYPIISRGCRNVALALKGLVKEMKVLVLLDSPWQQPKRKPVEMPSKQLQLTAATDATSP